MAEEVTTPDDLRVQILVKAFSIALGPVMKADDGVTEAHIITALLRAAQNLMVAAITKSGPEHSPKNRNNCLLSLATVSTAVASVILEDEEPESVN